MTQEEKDLLLKDLCARLPYGVKLKTDNVFPQKLEGVSFDKDTFVVWVSDGGFTLDYMECKPYLFPLSSMTEEQLFEVQEILGKNDIKIEDSLLRIVNSERNTISYLEILALLKWFYKNHFDVYGLIPKRLANDATGLKIY